jgi:hypothetical protein
MAIALIIPKARVEQMVIFYMFTAMRAGAIARIDSGTR